MSIRNMWKWRNHTQAGLAAFSEGLTDNAGSGNTSQIINTVTDHFGALTEWKACSQTKIEANALCNLPIYIISINMNNVGFFTSLSLKSLQK